MKRILTAFVVFGVVAGFGPHLLADASNFISSRTSEQTTTASHSATTATPNKRKVRKTVKKLQVRTDLATGYDRDAFGSSWLDVDDNGCDTRNDILQRDLKKVRLDSDGCTVLRGTLKKDPYTGTKIKFVRGPNSGDVQIDHIVALSNAWQHGAGRWSDSKREQFANDPRNLIAVDGPENMSKSDKAANEWLVPENPGYRCTLAYKQAKVKKAYNLTVTAAEKKSLKRAC